MNVLMVYAYKGSRNSSTYFDSGVWSIRGERPTIEEISAFKYAVSNHSNRNCIRVLNIIPLAE